MLITRNFCFDSNKKARLMLHQENQVVHPRRKMNGLQIRKCER